MKKTIKLLAFLLAASSLVMMQSCDEDETPPQPPVVSAPTTVPSVQVSNKVDVTFTFTAPGGFKSASATAQGGTATVKTPATAGATEGSVVVEFTAGTTTGAGAVTVTITDESDQAVSQTAAVSITADPPAPSIEPVDATSATAGTSIDVAFTVVTPGGYKSSAVSSNVTIKSQPAVGATGGTVVLTFAAPATVEGRERDLTAIELTVADNNDKNSEKSTVEVLVKKPIVNVIQSVGTGTVEWTNDNVYFLEGYVYVNSGVTLNVEAGTIIKFASGNGPSSSALVVARGGIMNAVGTANEPIIMTAVSDDVDDVDDLPINTRGQWGGLVVLGKAPINHASGQTFIEGLTQTDTRNQYGNGTKDDQVTGADDNSGTYAYISLRHGGTEIAPGNELNGFTLGGVGNGTTIHHIEVWGNNDDGFEFFGGTVNTSYLASFYNQDDSFDLDFGWRGHNQFWVAFQEPNFVDSDRGGEWDGAHSGNLAAPGFTQPTIFNMTLVGAQSAAGGSNNNALFLTEGMGGFVRNSIVANFRSGINAATAGADLNKLADRLAGGQFVISNTLFHAIGSATDLAGVAAATSDAATKTALETMLSAGANGNSFADPQLASIAAGSLDLRPAAAGPAFSGLAATPAGAVNGTFTYNASANFKGAFGTENWLLGWTAASDYEVTK